MNLNLSPARIQVLSPVLIDKIAAGEVIEGPSSVIKELLENSLDAGADTVRIDTHAAGTEQITVEDNGHGIHSKDLKASLTRHATSKIANLEDLEKILSFGFRGEALAALASISHLQIKSSHSSENIGSQILCRGGNILHEASVEHRQGTTVKVSNLFYSTPARRKYLKSARTENIKNYKEIIRLALANPQVRLGYYRETKEFSSYPAGQSLGERILSIYGEHFDKHLIEIEAEHNSSRLFGYISSPQYFRANREGQFSFVNKRPVELKSFSFMVRKAYDELLSPGMHPYFFLFLEIDPSRVDINVHPQKREVRILDQSLLERLVLDTIRQALRPHKAINIEQLERKKESFSSTRGRPQTSQEAPLLAKELQYSPAYVLEFGSSKKASAPALQKKQEYPERSSLESSEENSEESSENSSLEKISREKIPSEEPPLEKFSSDNAKPSSAELEKELSPLSFQFDRHFGAILGTYVLAEGDGSLYIIDQHTAHERVNYEKNLSRMEKLKDQRQELLEPILIHCLADELETILAHQEKLLKNGFSIEAAGPKSYAVREVPPYLDPGSEMEIFTHLIHSVMEGADMLHLYKDYAAMRACKASIKKNDYISNELLAEILKELPQCKEPARCPHGRPTMVQISRQELDRMFQR